MDETTKVLNTTFGGTILEDPLKTVFDCIIGMKVEAVEKGLTWVSDHAHIDFPHVPNDTFSLALRKSSHNDSKMDNFLAHPGDNTADAVSGTVIRVINAYRDAIKTETWVSIAVCCIWFLLVLMALFRACIVNARRDKRRGEGGEEFDNGIPDEQGFVTVPLGNARPAEIATHGLNRENGPAAPVYSQKPSPGEIVAASSPLPGEGFAHVDDWDTLFTVNEPKPAARK
ncbi:plasma membrane fusion protein prm1, partial [Ascosphaera aggregata]